MGRPTVTMTGNEDPARELTDRYLEEKLEAPSEASAEYGPPPEATDYMEDLTDADFSYVHPDNRKEYLETAVRALVSELTGDDGDQGLHGHPASAFREDGRVVVLMEGFGEIINVDRETATLLAFAYMLEPGGIDDPDP